MLGVHGSVRVLMIALALLTLGVPAVSSADDDNDNTADKQDEASPGDPGVAPASGGRPDLVVEYLGWQTQQPTLITFKVTNRGNAPSTPTTGKGETLDPPPAQITAPPIPAIAPGASFEIRYAVYPTGACDNQRVRMSVPQTNDRSSKDNTLEVQLCNRDKDVDLKLDYLGTDPTNQQLIHFKVTNVGKVPSLAAIGRVETISPLPAQETAPPIPALAPGASAEFPYALYGTTGCDNHVVKATVALAGDTYITNNTQQVQVCGPKPPPQEEPILVGPSPNVIEIPEYKRSGAHNVVLTPSYESSNYRDYFYEAGGCGPYLLGSGHGREAVGWLQVEENDDVLGIEYRVCAYIGEAQMVLGFPLDMLDEIPDVRVTRASLSFTEHEMIWRDNGGEQGCVTDLDFGPRKRYLSGPDSQTIFSVTDAVVELVAKGSPNARIGWEFVLRGRLALDQLEAEGSSTCMSIIQDPHLQVYYDVP